MIKMQNVRKVYPGFDFELSMEIPEGRITGLIGKNGAGKSTAIRLMLGLAKADGGIIELFGKPITEIMAEDRQNIGVSLAESGFNGQFTIVEVEKILAKMYPKFEESWFTRECQKLHLPEGKQFKEFSNGMKAKLRVLTALSHKAQRSGSSTSRPQDSMWKREMRFSTCCAKSRPKMRARRSSLRPTSPPISSISAMTFI